MAAQSNPFRQEADRRKFEQLGCIANILARHPGLSARSLAFLRGWTENAVAHGQVEIFFCDGLPLGYVAWAYLSEEVIGRLLHTDYFPHWSEWNEGRHVWIMDLCLVSDLLNASVEDFYCERFADEGRVFWSSELGDRVYRFDVRSRRTSTISRTGFLERIGREREAAE
ncbi:toxin-activating lysine-acyltransferase [Burkholderia perseverans]|uniref:toxin-activating lysine-acyltransferase n=1 Tax=Burkholderia perseverans TaxID=2615214 RepID=UPI001FED72B9|nr:toxin-activating lysine-acyltransferase [Burkholderia perseverans]